MKRYKCGQFLYYYDEASNSIKSYMINSIGKNAKSKVYWIFQDPVNHVTADIWPKIDSAYSTRVCELPDRPYFKSYDKAYKYYEDELHYNELKIIVDDLRQQFAKIEAKYSEKLKLDSNYTIKMSDSELKTDAKLYINGFGSVTEKLDALDKEVAGLKAKVEAKNKKRKSKAKKESDETKNEQEKAEVKKEPENEDLSRASE